MIPVVIQPIRVDHDHYVAIVIDDRDNTERFTTEPRESERAAVSDARAALYDFERYECTLNLLGDE